MADLRLDVSEERLQHHVLLLNDVLVVQDGLHGLVVTLLGIDRQLLQLVLVLLIIKDGLGQHDS